MDSRWGPYATRDAIKRGDWRKIAILAYDDFAAGKFEDLQRLYRAQDNFDFIDRTGFSQWASKVNGGVAEREADLNRMLTDGPYLMRHQELQKWKTTGQNMMTQVQLVGGAVAAPQTAKAVVNFIEDSANLVKAARLPSTTKLSPNQPRLLENLGEPDTSGRVFEYKIEEKGFTRVLRSGESARFTGKVDFVVTENDALLLGHKHTYLSGGAKVKFAGQLIFNNKGELIGINNASGHYKPNEMYLEPTLQNLKARGIDTSGVKLRPEPAFEANH